MMKSEIEETEPSNDSRAEGGRLHQACSPRPRLRRGMGSGFLLAALAIGSMGALGGGFDLSEGFNPMGKWIPTRKRRFPNGSCECCGKPKVRAGRERGVYLCADCEKENDKDQATRQGHAANTQKSEPK